MSNFMFAGMGRKGASVLLIPGFLTVQTIPMFGEIIPVNRLTTWQGNVGVPGGIPNRNTIYQTLNPGASALVIQNAINNCPSGQVVYLNAGTYNLGGSSIRIYTMNDWTLRGAGMGQTILQAGGSAVINVGSVPWLAQWPAAHNITSGATQGSTNVTLADDTAGINNGELMLIEQPNTGDVFGYGMGAGGSPTYNNMDRMNNGSAVMHLRVMVTGISGNTVTFTPPLPFSFDGSPRAVGFGGITGSRNFGIEDLTINGSTAGVGIELTGCYGSWVKNVEVTNFKERGIKPQWSSRLEFRGCYFREGFYGHDDGYAFEANSVNHCLVEDNIWYKTQAGLFLQGGCTANVIAYNVLFHAWNGDSGLDFMGPSFEACHSPYPIYNLFEGNYGNAFQVDFYYGPSRYGTLLRNYFPGTDPNITQHRIAVQIDSRQWDYNVIGNILGIKTTPGSVYLAKPKVTLNFAQVGNLNWTHGATNTDQFGYGENRIFRLGYPYVGNNAYSGTGNPPTPGGQLLALDLSVKPGNSHQTIIHGNWDAANQAVTWHSGITDTNIPDSLFRSGKPSWFGTLAWPPYNPHTPPAGIASALARIPAGYRLLYGANPPVGSGNQSPVAQASATPTAVATNQTVTFSSAGSNDPEGTALSYNWTFGDGTTSMIANPGKAYAVAGLYVARLTVSDGFSTTSSGSLNINVTNSVSPP